MYFYLTFDIIFIPSCSWITTRTKSWHHAFTVHSWVCVKTLLSRGLLTPVRGSWCTTLPPYWSLLPGSSSSRGLSTPAQTFLETLLPTSPMVRDASTLSAKVRGGRRLLCLNASSEPNLIIPVAASNSSEAVTIWIEVSVLQMVIQFFLIDILIVQYCRDWIISWKLVLRA